MLEKEKKRRGKRAIVLLMAMVLCMGTCVSVFAMTKTGSVYGMDYKFYGTCSNQCLYGSSSADDLAKNYQSYVKVEFQHNLVTKNSNICYGYYGKYVSLCASITDSSSNWRIYNSAKNKGNTSSVSVFAGAYTFY